MSMSAALAPHSVLAQAGAAAAVTCAHLSAEAMHEVLAYLPLLLLLLVLLVLLKLLLVLLLGLLLRLLQQQLGFGGIQRRNQLLLPPVLQQGNGR
jgi:hypothetical protein